MMIQVNLLPWREQTRKAMKKRFITVLIGFGCIALLVLVVLHLYLSSLNRYQQRLNDYLQTELTNEQAALNQINTKEDQMRDTQSNLRLIISLYSRGFHAIRLLNEMINVIPANVMINRIVRNENTITLSGIAPSDSDVTEVLQDIAKSPLFNQPVLTEISGHKNSTSTQRMFTLNVVEKD